MMLTQYKLYDKVPSLNYIVNFDDKKQNRVHRRASYALSLLLNSEN